MDISMDLSMYTHIHGKPVYQQNLQKKTIQSLRYIIPVNSVCVAVQISEQFCLKATQNTPTC